MWVFPIITAVISVLAFIAYIVNWETEGLKSANGALGGIIACLIVTFVFENDKCEDAVCYIFGISAALFFLVGFISFVKKKKSGLKTLLFSAILLVMMFVYGLDFTSNDYDVPSSDTKCALCQDDKATHGDYCYSCYKKLKGFQNTWG